MVRIILGLAAIPQSLGLLRYLSSIKELGELVIMLRVMTVDFFLFVVIYIFCVIGFGIYFHGIFYGLKGFETVGETILSLLQHTLTGVDFSIIEFDNEIITVMAKVLVILFLVITAVLLLNLLIARMTSSYQRVNERAFEEWSFLKAKTVEQYLLVAEPYVLNMLPPPLNILTIAVYPIHWLFEQLSVTCQRKLTT
jgi:hypothetical protein